MTGYSGPICDLDVHHMPNSDAILFEYLPKEWREYVHIDAHQSMPVAPPVHSHGPLHETGVSLDAYGDDGVRPAASYTRLREQLLDRCSYYRAMLTHNVGAQATHLNQYYARALCTALNDWNIDQWLDLDDRLYSVILAPIAEPDEAVREIRRVGEHPKLASVLIAGNPLGRPIGDPVFHPIYQAAADMRLSISIHVAYADRPNHTITAAGGSMRFVESVSLWHQQAMHYISSLITHGVFEKFPDLHFTFKEYGVAWLPSLMWRLDENYASLKRESPWVRDLPSNYIRRNIRLSTQPIESSPNARGLADYLGTVEGIEDILCFSSDYPHFSMDEPAFLARQLPKEWHRKVFCENACNVFGWKLPDEAPVQHVPAGPVPVR